MVPADWPLVREIYLEGIATQNATFEKSVPDWTHWHTAHLECCRLVAREQNQIVGWVALSPISRRPVYAGIAEVSVYVATKAWRKGIGSALLSALIRRSEEEGIWTLQAGIFPENFACIELHRKAGFRMVGVRERLAEMDGRWRDVVLLERRSKTVGV
jgi:phosphinothricin acetyltransferase